MKKAILLLVCSMGLLGLHAQPAAGTFSVIPRIGATLSNISNESFVFTSGSQTTPSDGKYKLGVMAGLDLQYQIMEPLAVSVGAFYQQGGCTYKDTDLSGAEAGTYSTFQNSRMSVDYISVPVMGHLYVAKDLSFNLGVQPAFAVRNRMHTEETSVTIGRDGSYTYTGQTTVTDQKIAYVNNFDLSIPLGISYEKENVVVDARYLFGVTKVFSAPLGVDNHNRTFILSAGYKFNVF